MTEPIIVDGFALHMNVRTWHGPVIVTSDSKWQIVELHETRLPERNPMLLRLGARDALALARVLNAAGAGELAATVRAAGTHAAGDLAGSIDAALDRLGNPR